MGRDISLREFSGELKAQGLDADGGRGRTGRRTLRAAARRRGRTAVTGSLLAAGGAIDYGSIFLDLAVILVVAKLAAELFERMRVPAVIGEIGRESCRERVLRLV